MTSTPERTAADPDHRLAAEGDPDRRAWWEGYLKGAAVFHGVPIATVREVVEAWYRDHGLAAVDDETFVTHLSAAGARPATEITEHGDRMSSEARRTATARLAD